MIVQAVAGRGATLNGSWQVMGGLDTRLTVTAEFGRSGATFHLGGQAASEPEPEYVRRAHPAGEAMPVTRQGGLYRLGVGGHDLAPVDAEVTTELAARALGNHALAREPVESATRFGWALARVSARLPSEAGPSRGLTRNRETESP